MHCDRSGGKSGANIYIYIYIYEYVTLERRSYGSVGVRGAKGESCEPRGKRKVPVEM